MSCQTIARVLAHSVGHPDAPPITSFQLRYPLQIHAELMTHRVFSRNARSSRAVPTARMLEEVRTAPFIPRYWGANQKGMQASEECDAPLEVLGVIHETRSGGSCGFPSWQEAAEYDGPGSLTLAKEQVGREKAWLMARDHAANMATAFAAAGYHKQIANRLLAPFLHIDVVLTTTNLSNWDALRIDPAAEPHIRDLAIAMREALEEHGAPTKLDVGQWHLPYIDGWPSYHGPQHRLVKQSVTRCAQVSYVPFHEAKLTPEQEEERHDALVNARPMHASPCEHQATPDRKLPDGSWEHPELAGNLGPGWIQYRKTLEGERA